MLQTLETVVINPILGAGALRELLYTFAAGTLQRVDIITDNPNGGGSTVFDVLINGATIFPGGVGRPSIASGASSCNVQGLTNAVVRGGKISITAASIPAGTVGSKLYIILTFDDGVAAGATRQTATFASSNLADGAEDNTHNVALAKSFIILSITTDFAARVRVYSTAAFRTADAARNETTLPTGLHGVVEDTVTAAGALTDNGSPYPPGASLEGAPSANIPIAVKNKSGAARVINVTIIFLALEA